jgi:hypothetical protein
MGHFEVPVSGTWNCTPGWSLQQSLGWQAFCVSRSISRMKEESSPLVPVEDLSTSMIELQSDVSVFPLVSIPV